jgi:hypothetical protein
MPSGVESVLSTVGGGRWCDAFYAICSIEFTDEFFPASAENTKSVSASGVPPNVPARLGTHSPFKDGRIAFEQSGSIVSQIGVKLRTLVS